MKYLVSILLILACGAAAAQTATTQTLAWTAPTTDVNGVALTGPITYNVFTGAMGAETQLVAGTSNLSVPVATPAGATVCAYVIAVVNMVSSAQSPEVCTSTVAPAPKAPTNIVFIK
jgi:hypothetical protein